jgi:TonB-dependent receptor
MKANEMRFKIKRIIQVMAAADLLAIAVPAFAQDVQPAATEVEAPLPAVVVQGFRKSYNNALLMKRSAVGVTDSISAEGLETLPDLNVGEALQRIAGIQVNRDEDSRNASVNLRGLPSMYAKVTINGMDFANPTRDGNAPMGAFDADMFSAFTVIKSVSAADQSGGIAGNIDMQVGSALSRKEGAFIKLSEQYETLGKYKSPKLLMSGSKKYLGGDLGVFGVLSIDRSRFRRDSIVSNNFQPLNPASTPDFLSRFADYYAPSCVGVAAPCVTAPGGTGKISNGGVMVPVQLRQFTRYDNIDMKAGVFGAEYKVTPSWKVSGTYLDSRRTSPEDNLQLLLLDTANPISSLNPTAKPFLHTDGRYYSMQYDFNNVGVTTSNRALPFEQNVRGVVLKSSYNDRNWRVDANATLSNAVNFSYEQSFDVRLKPKAITAANPLGNGISGSVNTGTGPDDFSWIFNRSTPVFTQASLGGTYAGTGQEIFSTTGDSIVITGTQTDVRQKVNTVRLDVERFVELPLLDSIQFGGQFNRNRQVSKAYRSTSDGVDFSKINVNSPFLMPGEYTGDFFGGVANGITRNWQTTDMPAWTSALQPTITGVPVRSLTGWANDMGDGGYLGGNFTTHSDIGAVYLMGKIDQKLWDIPVRGHIGVRHEKTKLETESLDRTLKATLNGTAQVLTPVFSTNTQKTEYSNTLPSLLLAADLTDKLVVRYGAYSTFIRPDPRANLPVATQISQDAINGGYTVNLGRGGIRPYTADSQDLSLEYYNRPNSMIGLALYQKKIKGLIVNETRDSVLCPADGYNLGLGRWSVVGDRCLSDVPAPATAKNAVNGFYTIDVNGALNSPNQMIVQGAELTVQQSFDFLPAPFNGLGSVFNYSYTRLRGKSVDGSPAALTNVSPRSANIILYYETPKWGVRGVYNYRNDYDLPGGTTFSGGSRSVRARGQFDISASYNLTEQLKLSINGFNLSNSYYQEYEGSHAKFRRASFDGRTFVASLRYTFF